MSLSTTKVVILGSGRIGIDLMMKIFNSRDLDLAYIAGRNSASTGLAIAEEKGIKTSDGGINFLLAHQEQWQIVFDATSASSHREHNPLFAAAGKFAIDLTPAHVGMACVPSINLRESDDHQNINLISCGGQASLPLAVALKLATNEIDYLEVVSTISADFAGLATRENINQYIETTEDALMQFSAAHNVKAILNINPARPGVVMQVTLYAYARWDHFSHITAAIDNAVAEVQRYVPGYKLVMPPINDNDRIMLSVQVRGSGHYLSEYAGNLDIINCAAIAVAERRHAQQGKQL